jgi:hypothetical protein
MATKSGDQGNASAVSLINCAIGLVKNSTGNDSVSCKTNVCDSFIILLQSIPFSKSQKKAWFIRFLELLYFVFSYLIHNLNTLILLIGSHPYTPVQTVPIAIPSG